MPPKKRKAIGQVQIKAKKIKQKRSTECPEDRLRNLCQMASAKLSSETVQEREIRLSHSRNRATTSRASESDQERQRRLQRMKQRATTSRASESDQEHKTRLQSMKQRATTSRAKESDQERKTRLQRMKQRATISRASESNQERKTRLQRIKQRATTSRASEREQERKTRLQRMKQRATISRASESNQERKTRLQRIKQRATTSRASESNQERKTRLQRMKQRATISRASESEQERKTRLQRMKQIATTSRLLESVDNRDYRLQNVRNRNRQSRIQHHFTLKLEAFHYDPLKDYVNHACVTIGKMDIFCIHCNAKRFKSESPGICCKNGKVKLYELEPPPPELLAYTSGDTEESKHFLGNIRKYNSCFQMTSFGATSVVKHTGFPTTFTVQGQVYHQAGSLLPLPDQQPKFLQIYFIGNDETETDKRCAYISGTRRYIVSDLQSMFHKYNKLIKTFKSALEQMPTDEYKVIIRADRRPAGEHERRFNAPHGEEIAVVMSTEDSDQRDIVIRRRSGSLHRISETHQFYDALQYPLIFPYGEEGYHFNLRLVNPTTGQRTAKKISAMLFYAYRLMVRDTQPNHILNCRQLFHQFVVDMYAKIETERLIYIRLNQRKLRSEEYVHLRDAVANDGNIDNIGSLVILPSTFTGSPRHMHEYTQDAMTYVRTYGRPDLFITFTCNPTCTEIKQMLTNGQTPTERHDLIARVFKQKQTKLMDVITKGHIFGQPKCWMYTIEWQKRGLPHSHNLIWLAEKIHPTHIDDIISAELPDPTQDPELFAVITTNMIHGPCGYLNRNSPCMKDERCSKKYPRKFIKETQTGSDGYPLYRRRAPEDGGFTTKIKIGKNAQLEIDNRWIVPYSPILSRMFHAHINVEYCNSVKSIKYVCKYINKGSDMAAFGISNNKTNDEVMQYHLGRYISSNEAVWRILGFQIHERYPPVVHLSVHLENGQRVYFTKDTATKVIDEPPNTTLIAFFKLCQKDLFARTLFYHEIPRYYTWNSSSKIFSRRKRGQSVSGHDIHATDTLGRVYTVHPNNAECYFLRILLHHVRGPTSFTDLKTVNGEVCQTYRETCQKLGLLERDQCWEDTMREAELVSFPEQIRNLFAIILTMCNPSNPNTLWEKHKEALSDDVLAKVRRENQTLEISFGPDIFNMALILLEDKCIAIANKTLQQVGLSSPLRNQDDVFQSDYIREKSYNVEDLTSYVTLNKPLLNHDQKNAYKIIMQNVLNQEGGIIFLDAPGGTGKTFLTNLILAEIRSLGQIALAIASSGIAATLMQGGRTAHSALRLPFDIARHENPTCNISKSSGQAQVLKICKLIVWDECTMAHKKSLEALDNTLRDLRENDRIMGGTLLLLCGDFRQTLPVIANATPADQIHACLKQSYLWKHMHKITLQQNMRVYMGDNTTQKFSNTLLEIGEGRLPVDSSGNIKFSDDFCTLVSSISELIQAVYPKIVQNYQNVNWLRERAILAAKNDDVHQINNLINAMIPGIVTEYKSIDTIMDNDEAVNFPTEFLNSLDPSGLPPHKLLLKVGSPIILLRNLDPPKLCNGTRLCVRNMLQNVIEATILTGKGEGEIVFIPRIPLTPTDLPFKFKRLQFPVRLAFSITINKSQGQSIKFCGIDLRTPCFSHGQLYVACSRVGSHQNLYILAPGKQTKNIVYNF